MTASILNQDRAVGQHLDPQLHQPLAIQRGGTAMCSTHSEIPTHGTQHVETGATLTSNVTTKHRNTPDSRASY